MNFDVKLNVYDQNKAKIMIKAKQILPWSERVSLT